MKRSTALLVTGVAIALGAKIMLLTSWHPLLTPAFVGDVLATIGGIALAWLQKSPIDAQLRRKE